MKAIKNMSMEKKLFAIILKKGAIFDHRKTHNPR